MRIYSPIRLACIMLLGAANVASPATASAQFSSSMRANCVGGTIGCQQVDFFVDFIGLTTEIQVDYFRFSITSAGWLFSDPAITEAQDAYGDNFYNPSVSTDQFTLNGSFDFGAFVNSTDNTLRIRTQFENYQDLSTLALDYTLGTTAQVLTNGSYPAATGVVPEPISMLLLGSGLAGVGAAARRRRSRREGEECT